MVVVAIHTSIDDRIIGVHRREVTLAIELFLAVEVLSRIVGDERLTRLRVRAAPGLFRDRSSC